MGTTPARKLQFIVTLEDVPGGITRQQAKEFIQIALGATHSDIKFKVTRYNPQRELTYAKRLKKEALGALQNNNHPTKEY